MRIVYLGHAGFVVETQHAVIVADPWLSPSGAFDASWFQLPRNHHLAPLVESALSTPGKAKFVYVSHEHEDHYDREFLDSLQNRDFTLVLPRYRRPALRKALADYRCREILAVDDGQPIAFEGGEMKLFLDDSELNRDSALFVRSGEHTFLNLNDCRIFDRLREIQDAEGAIEVFTCQFSGASWHPTCYEYSQPEYDRVSQAKVDAKFAAVQRAIQLLRPRAFLPSAGPVCFLDPELQPINAQARSIFRRAPDLLAHITDDLKAAQTTWHQLNPGDSLDVATQTVAHDGEPYDDAHFADYVERYAESYRDFFEGRAREAALVDGEAVLRDLADELRRKLAVLPLRGRVNIPLYFGLRELPDTWLRIDFPTAAIERVHRIIEPEHYSIVSHAWQIRKVLDGALSWENFGLSFRVRLRRAPDLYQPIIHAFLTMDRGDLYRFCRMITEIEERKERIEVTAGGKTYSVNRYCPHNGGDLKEGWIDGERYLVCARHRWCFDLRNGGVCTTNATSILAEEVGCGSEEVASTAAS